MPPERSAPECDTPKHHIKDRTQTRWTGTHPAETKAGPANIAPVQRASARYNALFLCTGNSSRSIMAEAILSHKGGARFTAYSAGSHPAGHIHPNALRQLAAAGLFAGNLRSKSWDEFGVSGAPTMDFIFTLCDNAAREVCPMWPGRPVTAHWGLRDPGWAAPDELERAFCEAFTILDRRIGLFLSLPLESIGRLALKRELDRIGRE